MKICSFGPVGLEQPGVLTEAGIIPLAELGSDQPASLRQLLAADLLPAVAKRAAVYEGKRLDRLTVRLGPPVPDPSKIICVGLNYKGHASEQGVDWPERPLLFAKAPSAVAGCRDNIVLPPEDACVDYEVELAVVIGRRARRVEAEEAFDHVAGCMVANDVSARRWQKNDGQWFRAKSCDSFFPCGPALVTLDEVGDLAALRLQTRIGDELLQDALAAELIHAVPELIATISHDMTLLPGDIISTGTPAGVGCYRSPRRFLAPEDLVSCSISGLGQLDNPVVASS